MVKLILASLKVGALLSGFMLLAGLVLFKCGCLPYVALWAASVATVILATSMKKAGRNNELDLACDFLTALPFVVMMGMVLMLSSGSVVLPMFVILIVCFIATIRMNFDMDCHLGQSGISKVKTYAACIGMYLLFAYLLIIGLDHPIIYIIGMAVLLFALAGVQYDEAAPVETATEPVAVTETAS